MKRWIAAGLLSGALLGGFASPAAAQEMDFLDVGEMAPDVEFPGVTRYGVLSEPVSLSQFRGETVVLAFFFRVRTRG
jgi:peroxiredoxin Q/BCP